MRFPSILPIAFYCIFLVATTPLVSQPDLTAARRHSLQARGTQLFNAEIAREAAGDCKDEASTQQLNICFSQQSTLTSQNFTNFEQVIRDLILNGQENQPKQDTTGVAGPSLTPQHLLEEFNRVEADWQHYSDMACTAAFHQFGGGTGGPSFVGQCTIKLTRDHMRELNLIYGNALHL